MSQTLLEVDGLCKRFSRGHDAVADVSFTVAPGEFFALLGASGSGKSTVLRMIGGFEVPDRGAVRLAGEDITYLPPNRRPVHMVFQSYAVFPHMSVIDNVAYGLKVAGMGRAERHAEARRVLEQVRLDHYANRKPDKLSGGERQRVALARALVKQPKLLLLDEPLSALDARLREVMRAELSRLQRQAGISFLMVTHDQEEALGLADRMGVMAGGKLLQVGTPREIYNTPNCREVAEFIGSASLLPGEVKADGQALMFSGPDLPAPVRIDGTCRPGAASLVVRPEDVQLCPPDAASDALVEAATYFGDRLQYEVRLASGRMLSVSAPVDGGGWSAGARISIAWPAGGMAAVAD